MRKFLQQPDWSQSALAAAIGVNQSTVSQYLSGEIVPSGHTQAAIAAATSGRIPVTLWPVRRPGPKPGFRAGKRRVA